MKMAELSLASKTVIRVKIYGMALPALLCSGFRFNYLSNKWSWRNLTEHQLSLAEGEHPRYDFPLTAFGKNEQLSFHLIELEVPMPICILGEPFFSAFSPLIMYTQDNLVLSGDSDETFLPEKVVETWSTFIERPLFTAPCEPFCLEMHRPAPGTYIPPGFPSWDDDIRIHAGTWINGIFMGLPATECHNLYAGAYTWNQIKSAYLEAHADFNPYGQCLCTLARAFAMRLPKPPTCTPFPGLEFAIG